jgi:hypothetical protein
VIFSTGGLLIGDRDEKDERIRLWRQSFAHVRKNKIAEGHSQNDHGADGRVKMIVGVLWSVWT